MNEEKGILLLGSSGLLAQAVALVARERGYQVFTLSRQQGIDLTSTKAGSYLREAFERIQPSLILNATGITDLNHCENNPEQAWMLHARVPALIASLTNQTQCPWVHISTDHYFSGQENALHKELDTPNPPNTYAASKLAGEALALTSPNALVIRTNIIGRRGWPSQPNFAEWAMHCLREQKPFDAYIDTWASSIEVGQFSKLLLILAEAGETGLMNLACSEAISKADFIEKMALYSGINSQFMKRVLTPKPIFGQLHRANAMGLDCTKAQNRLLSMGHTLPNANDVAQAVVKSFSE
jgi:dTDP-4-dehydrorhamnose reductase